MSINVTFILESTGYVITDSKASSNGSSIEGEIPKAFEFDTANNKKIIAGFTWDQLGINDVVCNLREFFKEFASLDKDYLEKLLNKDMPKIVDCCWFSLMITSEGDMFKIYCCHDEGTIKIEEFSSLKYSGAVNQGQGELFEKYIQEHIVNKMSKDDDDFSNTKKEFTNAINKYCDTKTCGGDIKVLTININKATETKT